MVQVERLQALLRGEAASCSHLHKTRYNQYKITLLFSQCDTLFRTITVAAQLKNTHIHTDIRINICPPDTHTHTQTYM